MENPSKLIQLPSGQIIGHPVTRTELKTQLWNLKKARRSAFRKAKKVGK